MHRSLLVILLFTQSVTAQVKTAVPDSGKGRLIIYAPASFSNLFTLNLPPVLHIRPGDTVRTETIDASGHDKNGVKVQKGGNPLTGPFFIEGCQEGDVLQITLVRIALNRL